jgi:hypothetical protein
MTGEFFASSQRCTKKVGRVSLLHNLDMRDGRDPSQCSRYDWETMASLVLCCVVMRKAPRQTTSRAMSVPGYCSMPGMGKAEMEGEGALVLAGQLNPWGWPVSQQWNPTDSKTRFISFAIFVSRHRWLATYCTSCSSSSRCSRPANVFGRCCKALDACMSRADEGQRATANGGVGEALRVQHRASVHPTPQISGCECVPQPPLQSICH